MGDVVHVATTRPRWSRRLLALAGDGRLVEQVRRGNEAAFEVVFERHGPAILGFCRHMLGSAEEAEDAVQHTFAAAYRDLKRAGERDLTLKPWLFAIARNRCISVLRARREQPVDRFEDTLATAGLAEEVEQRAELRRLMADVADLPDEQRAALLLTELGDLSHADVAGVLGCEVARVKALVFRARSGLIARRDARDTPCEIVQEQLANLRGGALRRTELRLHLRDCPGCRAYREQVRQQRQMLAAALPVVPTLGLKSSVLAAVGAGGGSAGGLAVAAGSGGALGGAAIAKIAAVAVLAGGVVAGEAVVGSDEPVRSVVAPGSGVSGGGDGGAVGAGVAELATDLSEAARSRLRGEGPTASGEGKTGQARSGERSGKAKSERGRGLERGRRAGTERGRRLGRRVGHERKAGGGKPERGPAGAQGLGADRGRGPIEAPPAQTPVKRGPPPTPEPQTVPAPAAEPKVKTQAAPSPPPPAEPVVPEPPKVNGKTK